MNRQGRARLAESEGLQIRRGRFGLQGEAARRSVAGAVLYALWALWRPACSSGPAGWRWLLTPGLAGGGGWRGG